MKVRFITSVAVLAALAMPGVSSAALTAGGPWVPNVTGLAIVNDTTWLASGGLEVSRTTNAGASWRTSVGSASDAPDAPSWVTSVAASGGVAFAAGYWAAPVSGSGGGSAVSFGVSTDGGTTWKWSKISESLSVPKLVADPSNANRLLLYGARIAGGGGAIGAAQYAAFVTDDRGAAWRAVTSLPTQGATIAVGPDGTLYAGTSRSTDWGASWQPIAMTDSAGTPLSAVTAGPVPYGANGLVMAAQAFGASGFQSGTDLLFSDNRGDSWTRVSAGLPMLTGSTVLANAPDGQVVLIANGAARILRRDGSTAATFPERELQSTGPSGVAGGATVIPTNGGVVVVSAGGSENRSTGIPSYGVVESLAVSPANPAIMLADTPSGLYRSADGGTSWTYAGNRFAVAFSRAGVAGAVAQVTVTTENATSMASQLEVSTDGGATWTSGASLGNGGGGLVPIAWAGDTRAYIVGSGLVRSDDRLATITPLPSPASSIGALAASADNPDLVFASTSNGVFRSTDAGASWTPLQLPGVFTNGFTGGGSTGVRVAIAGGAQPAIVVWAPGLATACASANLGSSFTCTAVPYFPITSGNTTSAGVVRTLAYQSDGTVAATVGQSPNLTTANVATSLVLRSSDNVLTWATTEDLPLIAPTAAVDVTGRSGRAGKKSAAGKRRFALASTGVIRRSLTFALLAKPGVTTAGIKVGRAAGGSVTVPITCEKGRRCSGVIEGQMRVSGRSVKLAATRFSIVGSRGVRVGIATTAQKTFKSTRGVGTISLRVRYTDPTGKKRNPILTARGAVTVP